MEEITPGQPQPSVLNQPVNPPVASLPPSDQLPHPKPLVSIEFIVLVVVILLGFIAFAGYPFYLFPSLDGQSCKSDLACAYILKCFDVNHFAINQPQNKLCLTDEEIRARTPYQPASSLHTSVSPSPPPTGTWHSYTNQPSAFSITYPPTYKVLVADTGTQKSELPTTIFSIEKRTTFPNTVLSTTTNFLIQAIPNAPTSTACDIDPDTGKPLMNATTEFPEKFYYQQVQINGAAGTHQRSQAYRIFNTGNCLEIDYKYAQSSDWNNPTDATTADNDLNQTYKEFDRILSTFEFIKSATPTSTGTTIGYTQGGCERGGCGDVICQDKGGAFPLICVGGTNYACYQAARCEKQANGHCGWTKTDELTSCLAKQSPTP